MSENTLYFFLFQSKLKKILKAILLYINQTQKETSPCFYYCCKQYFYHQYLLKLKLSILLSCVQILADSKFEIGLTE